MRRGYRDAERFGNAAIGLPLGSRSGNLETPTRCQTSSNSFETRSNPIQNPFKTHSNPFKNANHRCKLNSVGVPFLYNLSILLKVQPLTTFSTVR
ncbi:MAG TPA: hypothetical protein VFQ52_02650, partial [Rhizomicrobium sp.]|nr:hypothetical protein [Rhizomicrobium sp.]